jgi:signal transduction histidine kinase
MSASTPEIPTLPRSHADTEALTRDPDRLAALRASGLLDSPPEEEFERLTRLAKRLTGASAAFISLVDADRTFYKSCVGFGEPLATVRELEGISFCNYTLHSSGALVIPDTRADPVYRTIPAVEALGVAAYVGVPIRMGNGHVLGSFCAIDDRPHPWTETEIDTLVELATSAEREIRLRYELGAQRRADRVKDEFVSVVSHELRTPLTSLRGSLGLLASGQVPADRATRLLELAVRNTDRLVRLINDFLDLERMSSGRAPMEVGPVTADALVAEAFEAVRGAATEAGVPLRADVPPIEFQADADRMVQVLVNLVANAIKFSDAGAEVVVKAEDRGTDVLFQVRDRGRGIPADKLEVVFERFRQVDGSDARDRGGTGLGLPIARSIAEGHGGRMWVASEWGRGSTFFFTVPRISQR